MHYKHTCTVHVAIIQSCKYSGLLLWHIAAPGAVFSCNFNHKSIVRDLQYLLVIQVQLASDIKLRPPLPTREERAQALRAAECTNKRYSSSLTSAMRVFTQLQSTHVFSPRCMQVASLSTIVLYTMCPAQFVRLMLRACDTPRLFVYVIQCVYVHVYNIRIIV